MGLVFSDFGKPKSSEVGKWGMIEGRGEDGGGRGRENGREDKTRHRFTFFSNTQTPILIFPSDISTLSPPSIADFSSIKNAVLILNLEPATTLSIL